MGGIKRFDMSEVAAGLSGLKGDSKPPEGMTPPKGMSFPEGMTPPEGMSLPEGMAPPKGMPLPGGMEPRSVQSGGTWRTEKAEGISDAFWDPS